jgi:death-associated protein kinase
LKIDGGTDEYIEQLIPTTTPISKIKVKLFGHSGVGKSSLLDSLKAGYFSSLFRRSKRGNSFSTRGKQHPRSNALTR